MRVYRVFTFDPGAKPGTAGHPDYLHRPQGSGRLDNPSSYDVWYYAAVAEAAVGEVFGDLPVWSAGMFTTPFLPSGRRSLGVFDLDDDIRLLDLDDATVLRDRGLRPTEVVVRNSAVTKTWAKLIFDERDVRGQRAWDGVRWWSYWKPHWTVFGVWTEPEQPAPHRLVEAERLELVHPAVIAARLALVRPMR